MIDETKTENAVFKVLSILELKKKVWQKDGFSLEKVFSGPLVDKETKKGPPTKCIV